MIQGDEERAWTWRNTLLTSLRARCRASGMTCDLSLEYLLFVWGIQNGRCAYTDIDLRLERGAGKHPLSASFDRVNPGAGYTIGNVLFVSFRANAIKHDMTISEFLEWMPMWFAKGESLLALIRASYAMNRVTEESL